MSEPLDFSNSGLSFPEGAGDAVVAGCDPACAWTCLQIECSVLCLAGDCTFAVCRATSCDSSCIQLSCAVQCTVPCTISSCSSCGTF